MKIEELKKLDVFKNGRLEKILALPFMNEEFLEELTDLYPPHAGRWTPNAKDLTAVYQDDILKAYNKKYEENKKRQDRDY